MDGDCPAIVIDPFTVWRLDSPIVDKVLLKREGGQLRRCDGATATFSHLLVIVEDVDHRAHISDGSDFGVGTPRRVNQAQDIVAVAGIFAEIPFTPKSAARPRSRAGDWTGRRG